MKRFISHFLVSGILCLFVSCNYIDDMEKISKDIDSYIHNEPGTAKYQGFNFGTFYTSDNIKEHSQQYGGDYVFAALKDESQFAEIQKQLHKEEDFVTFADSTNAVEIMAGESKGDIRTVHFYVKTEPVDAAYDWIRVTSSNENVVKVDTVAAKHYKLTMVDVGQTDLTVSVGCVDGVVDTRVYPVTICCIPTMMFDALSMWTYKRMDSFIPLSIFDTGIAPFQTVGVGTQVTELPKIAEELPYLASMRIKIARRCTYQDVNRGSKKVVKLDTVELSPRQFIGKLKHGKTYSILHLCTTDFSPCYEITEQFQTFTNVQGNDTTVVVTVFNPYVIENIRLVFDAKANNEFYDFEGQVNEEQELTMTDSWELEENKEAYETLSKKIENYDDYNVDNQFFDAQVSKDGLLTLIFNEFLTDKQIDSLINFERESFESHGWTEAQVDSLWRDNQRRAGK